MPDSLLTPIPKHGPRVVIAEPAPMPTAVRARFHPGEDRAKLADVRAEFGVLTPANTDDGHHLFW